MAHARHHAASEHEHPARDSTLIPARGWLCTLGALLFTAMVFAGVPTAFAFDEHEFQVRDINAGGGDSLPEGGAVLRTGLFVFAANDGTNGTELWATDGTKDGTKMLKDIRQGSDGSFPHNFSQPITFESFTGSKVITKTLVFFAADDGVKGTELWATDGTADPDGTFLVSDIRTTPGAPHHDPLGSSFPHNLTVLNGKLIFAANDGETGVELWCHDPAPTAAGAGITYLVKDIWPGDESTHSLPSWLTVVGNNVYFAASDHRTVGVGGTGTELWKTDGTDAGTVLVADLYPGPGSGAPNSSGPEWLANLNGVLLFVAWNGTGFDNQLWRSTGAGASLVKVFGELNSPPEQLRVVGNRVFFAATDHLFTHPSLDGHGQELWASDGTGGGTFMVKDINTTTESGVAFGSAPRDLVNVNGRLFFTAVDNATDRELWTSDGTPGGTVRVADLRPGLDSSRPERLTACGRLLYFSADDGTRGRELWRVKPESLATTPVAEIAQDINPGGGSSLSFQAILGFGGRHLFFAASDGTSGTELWAVEYVTYLVTSTADSGTGSLRQAILDANAFINHSDCIDRICIDIAGPGPHHLNIQSQLPAITDPVTICDPLYNPEIDARFLVDGNLIGVTLSGLIILRGDTEVIGIGFTRVKTGVKLSPDGANINLQGLLFLQISDVGIEANLTSTGIYDFKEGRFRGGMAFGTKVNISGDVEVVVNYRKNSHDGNQVAVEANEQLSGSATWTVANNIAKNGGTGARFFIKVAGSKDFKNNRWEGHASAGLKYVCNLSQSVTVIVTCDGDVATGNGIEGLRGEVGALGEVRFRLIKFGSSNNGGDGLGLYGQLGGRVILDGSQLDVQRNGGIGLYVQGGSAAFRAGYHLQDSVIKDNDLDGQWTAGVDFGFSMLNNTVTGNGRHGLVLTGDTTGNITGNTISSNAGAGVLVQDTASPSLTGNTITGNGTGIVMSGADAGATIAANAVFANIGLGIDLGNDGMTFNDAGDADGKQNFPVLTSAVTNAVTTSIGGALASAPNRTCTIRFFSNTVPDASVFGEGEVFIGFLNNVATDGSGNASFVFTPAASVPVGRFVTATATSPEGKTSEFSKARMVTGPDTDGDGMTDEWELHYFAGIDDPDGAAGFDFDGDGLTNLSEFQAGTAPDDSTSNLRLMLIDLIGDEVQLRFNTAPFKLYDVQSTTDLNSGSWSDLIRFVPGTGGEVDVMVSVVSGLSREFYRVRLVP